LLADVLQMTVAPFKASSLLGAFGSHKSSQISTPNVKLGKFLQAKTTLRPNKTICPKSSISILSSKQGVKRLPS